MLNAFKDWEGGMFDNLLPLLQRVESPLAKSKKDALLAIESVEKTLQIKYPTMLYSDILAHAHAELAARLTNQPSHPDPPSAAVTESSTKEGSVAQLTVAESSTSDSSDRGLSEEDVAFGKSIPKWPAFPDTIPALATLSKYYKLSVLSNVDRESFSATRAILERSDPNHQFTFDAIYTAQDIGSYKPNPANFEYALAQLEKSFGIKKDEVLVVACSLFHDHVPANTLGLKSVFIDREGATMGFGADAKYNWKFQTVGAFAEEVEKRIS